MSARPRWGASLRSTDGRLAEPPLSGNEGRLRLSLLESQVVSSASREGGTGSAPGPSKGDVQSAGSQDQATGGNRTYYTIEPEGIFRYTVRIRPQDDKFEFETLEQFVGCDGIGGA